MYDAVNNLGLDLWKAQANGDHRVYDIRVTRDQNRMHGHMFRDCAVVVPDVERFISKMESEVATANVWQGAPRAARRAEGRVRSR